MVAMTTKVAMLFAMLFTQKLHICNQYIDFHEKVSFLAQRVHVSEILCHFSQIYPTHSRSVYDTTGMILPILYREVPHLLYAKYQPNWPSGSGEEVV